jgi:protein pelota
VHITLSIKVTKLEFDASASQLHVSGKVSTENQYVKLGGYHTLDLELNRQFTLEKADGWDSVALEQLRDAIDTRSRAQIWAVIMTEGMANICYITEYQTKLVQQVSSSIPKKRATGSDYDKALARFHTTLYETLSRQMDLANTPTESLPAVLLASPGFAASNFFNYIKSRAQTEGGKTIPALIGKITLTHSSSANLSALAEVMKSPPVLAKLQDSKFARETQLLDKFYECLRRDDGMAWYGPKEVVKCVEKGAVGRGGGVLLISNTLFRNENVAERKKWVGLVDRVRDVEGGEIRVLSEAHESGKRLEALGGVAALLTFPIFDLDDEDEEARSGENCG